MAQGRTIRACPRFHSRSARRGSSTPSTAGSSVTAQSFTPRTAAKPGASARDDRCHASTEASENAMTWYRFGEWILRRRFAVLAVVGVLTAFFAYFAAQTQLVTSFGELLPQNHPFIKIAHKYDQYFGSVNNVTIMIEAKEGTIYKTEIIEKIVHMTRNMDLVYGIQHGSVRSLATSSYF